MVKKLWSDLKINRKFSFLMIFVSAFLYVFSIQIFLKQAQAFSNGISAVAIFLTFLSSTLESYFSIFYLVLNLPLIAFFWKKIKRNFVYKTSFFLLSQLVLGFIMWIPGLSSSLDKFFREYNDGVWSGVFFSSIAGVISGFAIGISWKHGGSCGGTDIIAYYYSTKRKRPVSLMLFVVSLSFALFSIAMSIIFIQDQRENSFSRICSTFVFIFISSLLVEWIYPRYSKVEINIHSDKIDQIVKYLKESDFSHAFQIQEFYSPHVKKNKKSIKSVVFLLEVKPLVIRLKNIDPNIWIASNRIMNIWGKFATKSVD